MTVQTYIYLFTTCVYLTIYLHSSILQHGYIDTWRTDQGEGEGNNLNGVNMERKGMGKVGWEEVRWEEVAWELIG